MTDANDILAALKQDPESIILAAMLTDALMEERDMLRSEADRHVERVQRDARDLRDIQAAADIMSAGDGRRLDVLDKVIAVCWPDEVPPSFSWVIVAGDAPPISRDEYKSNPGAWWYETVVTVGACWIIKTAGRTPHPAAKPARRRRG